MGELLGLPSGPPIRTTANVHIRPHATRPITMELQHARRHEQWDLQFLGVVAKLRKATISFVTYVHASVEQLSYLSIFRKSVGKFQVSLKSDEKNGYYSLRPMLHSIVS
jgi:hypothetical protein